MHRALPFVVAWLALALVFGVLERLAPAEPHGGARRLGPETRTDLAYWLFTPLVTRAIGEASVVLAVSLAAVLLGHARDKAGVQAFAAHRSLLARQPRGLQLVEILFLADLLGYAAHRLFHRGRLWRFHAVHHSARALHWLSSVRVHPVNEVVAKLCTVLPLLAFGFDTTVVAAVLPLVVFYSVFIHANLRWDFGPLRYVVATPAFHRWHHAAEIEGRDRNFAGLFPVIDLVFGTFFLPEGRRPRAFGVPDLAIPTGLLGQLAWPFRRAPRGLTSAGGGGTSARVLRD